MRLVSLLAAFAFVFAPGEVLGHSHDERPPAAVAAAVLAPTFVSTPAVRSDPPMVVRSAPEDRDGHQPATAHGPLLLVAVAVLGDLARRWRPSPGVLRTVRLLRERGLPTAGLRAPPRTPVLLAA